MNTSIICISILAFILLSLGTAISIKRLLTGAISFNTRPDPTSFLTKIVRAHGNTAEFAPMLSIMFYYLGTGESPIWVGWCIILATFSRILVIIGFITCQTLEKISTPKAIGAVGTYVFGFALVYACIQRIGGLP